MSLIFLKKKNFFLFFVLLSISLFGLFNHEIWRDEGKFVQISTELNFFETVKYSRYEGLIPFYTVILEILYYIFQSKIFALKFFNFFFFLITAIILFNKKELPPYLAFLVLSSYPILSNYLLVSRVYIMLVPSIFYLILYENKPSKFVFLNMINLSMTGIFGLIFNFCYFVSNFDYFKKYIFKRDFFLILLIITSTISFYFILPFVDREWNELRLPPSFYYLGALLYKIMYSTIFLHEIWSYENIWAVMPKSFLINNFLVIISLSLMILTVIYLYLSKNFNELKLLITTIILFFLFFSITTHHSFKHYYLIFIIFSAICIKTYYLKVLNKKISIKNIYNFVKYFTILFMFCSLILALVFRKQSAAPLIHNLILVLNYISFFLICSFLYIKKDFKIFYIIILLFSSCFIYFSINNTYSYEYLFFNNLILILLSLKIFLYDKKVMQYLKVNFNLLGRLLFIICLAISAFGSYVFILKEYKLDFSNSKNLAEFINNKNISCNNIAAYPESTISSWSAYLNKDCKPFQIRRGIYSSFTNANLIKKKEKDDSFQYRKISQNQILNKKMLIVTCINDCKEEEIFFSNFLEKYGGSLNLFNNRTLANVREKFIVYTKN